MSTLLRRRSGKYYVLSKIEAECDSKTEAKRYLEMNDKDGKLRIVKGIEKDVTRSKSLKVQIN